MDLFKILLKLVFLILAIYNVTIIFYKYNTKKEVPDNFEVLITLMCTILALD